MRQRELSKGLRDGTERKTDYGRHDGWNFTKSMRILLQTYFLAFTQILNEFKYLKRHPLKE